MGASLVVCPIGIEKTFSCPMHHLVFDDRWEKIILLHLTFKSRCNCCSSIFRSKAKRTSVDEKRVPSVQFLATYPPKPPPPPVPSEVPPPPRLKRPSVPVEKAAPRPPSSSGRGALLSQIQKGARLKATKTNDRSAPRVWAAAADFSPVLNDTAHKLILYMIMMPY